VKTCFIRKECQLVINFAFDDRLQKPVAKLNSVCRIAWLQGVDFCCFMGSKLQQLIALLALDFDTLLS
jgi:hypothetical protein